MSDLDTPRHQKEEPAPSRYFFLLFDPVPAPDREPERRRLELPRVPFFGPVPDAPGRFALFRAPVDPVPEVCPLRAPGASGFEPRPFAAPRSLRVLPGGPAISPVLSEVVRVRLWDAVPRARPPRPPPLPPVVSSAVSRLRVCPRFDCSR